MSGSTCQWMGWPAAHTPRRRASGRGKTRTHDETRAPGTRTHTDTHTNSPITASRDGPSAHTPHGSRHRRAAAASLPLGLRVKGPGSGRPARTHEVCRPTTTQRTLDSKAAARCMVMDRSSVTVPKPPKRNVIRIKVRLLLCAHLPADVSCCVPSRGPRGCASPLRSRTGARARRRRERQGVRALSAGS